MESTSAETRSGLAFRVDEVVVDSVDPRPLARFWAELLGYVVVDSDDAMYVIEDPRGAGLSICFQKVPEAKLAKNRLHLDVTVPEGMFEKGLAKVLRLGGAVVDVGQPPMSSWAVLADPEGNEFCLTE